MKKGFIFLFFCLIFLMLILMPQSANCQKWQKLLNAATFDMAVNPHNPNTIFAGGESRYFYRSYDGGKTWDTLIIDYVGGSERMNNMTCYPADTNVVIVGGINFSSVYRTTDHGNTWKIVLQDLYQSILLNGKALAVDPVDSITSFITDCNGGRIFKSTDMGLTWDSITTILHDVWIQDTNGIYFDTLVNVRTGCIGIRSDSTNIILVGSTFGNMYISTDGGYHWKFTDSLCLERPPEPNDNELTRICFSPRDSLVGYCVNTFITSPDNTPNGGLWQTTDGGYNWHLVALGDTSMWAAATRGFGNDDEVFVGGFTDSYFNYRWVPGTGEVRRTRDNGKTWTVYDNEIDWNYEFPQIESNINSIFVKSIYQATAAGEQGLLEIMKFHEYKFDWGDRALLPNSKETFNSLFFTDSLTGYVCGNGGVILKTTDEGISWTQQIIPSPVNDDNLTSVFFINQNTGYVSSDSGKIIMTTNAGATWSNTSTPSGRKINSLKMKTDLIGIAAGDTVITKTTNGGIKWERLISGVKDTLKSVSMTSVNNAYISGNSGLMIKTTDGGSNWLKLSMPTSENLNSCCFTNDSVGWAVGTKGTILKTTDYGNTWNTKPTYNFINYMPYGICFPSSSIGYIATAGGRMLKTTDAGNSWNKLTTRSFWNKYTCYFINDTIGWLAGENGQISLTTNGGKNWKFTNRDNYTLYSIYFPDAKNGYSCGSDGIILKSTDSGHVWTKINDSTIVSDTLFSIFFTDSNTGYSCGKGGLILKTIDGGTNWKNTISGSINFRSLYFINSEIGFAVGDDGTILKTINSGANWIQKTSPTTHNLSFVWFQTSTHGYITGQSGTILETTDGGETWSILKSDTDENITALYIGNDNIGTAIGTKSVGSIMRTSDAGKTWYKPIYDTTNNFNSVHFLNDTLGYVAGDNRMIYRTTDGGNEWSISQYGHPQRALIWSLRYFGTPGKEKLYMASEAGFFMMDMDTTQKSVEEQSFANDNSDFSVFVTSSNTIVYKYKPQIIDFGRPIIFRVVNIIGQSGLKTDKHTYSGEYISGIVDSKSLAPGVYICQIIDGTKSKSKVIIIE